MYCVKPSPIIFSPAGTACSFKEYNNKKKKGGSFIMAVFALVLAVILFLSGLAGTVLPVLPGVTLIYGGMVLYSALTGFTALNTNFFILQGLAVLLVFAIDYLATAVGSRRYGGSKYAAWGAMIGIVIGVLTLGPFGMIAGPFIGAVTAELITGRQPNQAVRTGFGTIIGLLGGTVLKLSIEVLMIIWFFMAIA
jgi:hypothetical protein